MKISCVFAIHGAWARNGRARGVTSLLDALFSSHIRPFARRDDRWNLVDDDTKKWLQFQVKEDGEFWMSYNDFLTHFQEVHFFNATFHKTTNMQVTICTLEPDFDGDGASEASEHILCAHGAWRLGVSAGGCRNDLDLFATNPQFALTVHAPGAYDEEYNFVNVIPRMQTTPTSRSTRQRNVHPLGTRAV